MHVTRFAVVALLAVPLGGCFGVRGPLQPLPDWAMSPQAQYEEEPAVAPVKHRAVRRASPPQEASSRGTLITGEASATPHRTHSAMRRPPQVSFRKEKSRRQAGTSLRADSVPGRR